eukprot:TRINITY_DN1863_c0_g1_i6.p4 TRINITY_DN1863_c0_g1~~TRINITY_DN1863_c0_g1_i6.p4  ORF type:complete len:104 (-),score=38.40 TRINITY_DN1863_c0_g1_i6:318-629(-)
MMAMGRSLRDEIAAVQTELMYLKELDTEFKSVATQRPDDLAALVAKKTELEQRRRGVEAELAACMGEMEGVAAQLREHDARNVAQLRELKQRCLRDGVTLPGL